MGDPHQAWPRLWLRLLALAGAILAGGLLLLPLAYHLQGSAGLLAAVVAATICLLCGAAAAVISEALRPHPQLAMYEVLVGAGLRMGVPLALCMLIYRMGGLLVRGQFVFYLLAFYLLMLMAEIVIAIRLPHHFPG